MADESGLGEILGGVLAALAHARRVADEETVAIAEYYRNEPLLAGMSVPRVRVPQLEVEIPVVIERFTESSAGKAASGVTITAAAVKTLKEAAARERLQVPQTVTKSYEKALQSRLQALLSDEQPGRRRNLSEAVARETQAAFLEVLKQEGRGRFEPAQVQPMLAALRDVATRVAMAEPAAPPEFRVSVLTSDVKDRADPKSVARIHLTIREDGVEWATIDSPDGTTRGQLIPE